MSAVNRLLNEPPRIDGTTYVHAPPAWLLAVCRVAFGSLALLLGVMSWRSWDAMPLPACALVLVLVPAFLALSVWSRPWARTVKFMADEQGICFPANELLVVSFGPVTRQPWLKVPWENIRDVRVAREAGEDGRCVAFDVEVTPEEAAAFFKHVGTPRDRSHETPGTVFAAYGDSPPRPARTVERLLALKARSGA